MRRFLVAGRGLAAHSGSPSPETSPSPATAVSTTQSSMRADALVEEVAERHRGPLDADEGVQVGAAEVGVDEDDLLAELRQVDAEVGGEQRLADAALAAADGDDAARGAARVTDVGPDARVGDVDGGIVGVHGGCRLARPPDVPPLCYGDGIAGRAPSTAAITERSWAMSSASWRASPRVIA